jgi:hypothetical protein
MTGMDGNAWKLSNLVVRIRGRQVISPAVRFFLARAFFAGFQAYFYSTGRQTADSA